jgi:branched-chain amino acid transport system substrate-binding protein
MKLSIKSFTAFMTVIVAIAIDIAITSALTISSINNALAKVEGDTIILGSAISLTGKYATNGLHTQRGYDYAVKVINEKGGVTVNGKSYQLAVKYYDDESTPARGAQLAE